MSTEDLAPSGAPQADEPAAAADTVDTEASSEAPLPTQEPKPVSHAPHAGARTAPKQKKTRNVVFYLLVMFCVALMLILLSFLMQQRNHEALLQGISSSNSSVQALVDLQKECLVLQDELDETRGNLDAAREEISTLRAELEEAKAALQAAQANAAP